MSDNGSSNADGVSPSGNAFAVTRSLLLAFGCLAMALGIVGNAGILWLFRRRCFLGESTRATFRLLAVADLAVMLISLTRYLSLLSTGWDLRSVSDPLCRMHIFGVYLSTDVSGWIVCLIATERLLAVVLPTRRFGVRLMVGVVCGLLAGSAVKNHCLLYIMRLIWVPIYSRAVCISAPEFNFDAFIACDLALRILLPSLYLLAVNGSLLCRYACASGSAASSSNATKEAKAFRMLFGISVYFFVSMLPSRFMLVYRALNPGNWTPALDTAYSGLILLSYTNNCFSLYIYALTSPSVRRLIMRDLPCSRCCCAGSNRRVAPQSATVEADSTVPGN